jgi:[protein-PII] uridylyltransferase
MPKETALAGTVPADARRMPSRDLSPALAFHASPEEEHAHSSLLSDRYFFQTDPADVRRHLRLVHELLRGIADSDSVGALRPSIDWADGPLPGTAGLHLATWDRPGLFAKLVGALTFAGLDIVSARIATRADHIALDDFTVREQSGGLPTAREFCNRAIEDALTGRRTFPVPPDHGRPAERMEPLVEIYRDTLAPRFIIEVHAADHPGLLPRLATTLAEHGMDVNFARIDTIRQVAFDTFHVAPAAHQPAPADADIDKLRQALAAAAR